MGDPLDHAALSDMAKDNADGLSLKAIAVKLNAEGLAFPAKATRRGPERLIAFRPE